MDDGKQIVGLTGGTGSGKSSVAQLFAQRGIFVIDADQVSREVCQPGEPCLQEIVANFGTSVLHDGRLDRKKLGNIVFKDDAKRNMLNSITHKYIRKEILRRIEKESGPVIVDAALLFESGFHRECTSVISVVADPAIRAQRIAARDDLTIEQAMQRIGAQHDNNYYTDKADFVIYNNGDLQELATQMEMVYTLLFVGG